jgi:riboflavin synthase
MFTGIITGLGTIASLHDLGPSAQHGKCLTISAPVCYLSDVGLGDSVALNGACMTVTGLSAEQNQFTIDISAGLAEEGRRINLEKALRASDRLGGHIVSGHVDGVGTVSHFGRVGESWELRVLAPTELGRFLAYKGSITVNGVSLTVNRVADYAAGCEFSINLIPHTVENTSLGDLQAGHSVNLEVDTVARYVERMLQAGVSTATPSPLTLKDPA